MMPLPLSPTCSSSRTVTRKLSNRATPVQCFVFTVGNALSIMGDTRLPTIVVQDTARDPACLLELTRTGSSFAYVVAVNLRDLDRRHVVLDRLTGRTIAGTSYFIHPLRAPPRRMLDGLSRTMGVQGQRSSGNSYVQWYIL